MSLLEPRDGARPVTGQRMRLDQLLVSRGLFESRERAQAAVLVGRVLVEGVKETKAGRRLPPDTRVELVGEDPPYASRGGLKLEKALDTFGLDVTDLVCLDVGASTGGFTDCLLQRGARRVYAVDVGWGQLAWRLRQDPRVVVLERTNARYLTRQQVPEPVDFASFDLSFISLSKVLPAVVPLLAPGARLVCLVKPQFEAGRGQVGRGGVVRDPSIHRAVLARVAEDAAALGLTAHGLTFSPVTGDKGNIEFLLCLEPGAVAEAGAGHAARPDIDRVVAEAHQALAPARGGGPAEEG